MSTRLKGGLNLFQASMLRWRAMHPYNAVHLVRVTQALDAERLRRVIETHLAANGLTGLVLDERRARYEYRGPAQPVSLPVVRAASDPLPVINAEIERQLNIGFPQTGPLDPFRFFAVDAGSSFHLGVAYDHFVGAGDSIVVLLKGLSERYTGAAPSQAQPKLELYPRRYRSLMWRQPLHALGGIQRFWELAASCRHAYRPCYPGAPDATNAFACIRIEAPHVERFAQTAKGWGVTQNDLMIAMLMLALSELAAARRSERRRNELAIASIMNLRRDFDYTPAAAFGQFLSSFRVSHAVPSGTALQTLAQDVRMQTARARRKRRYYQTLLAMQVSGAMWRFLSPDRRANFHCKNYPVWAGTTPLNVDSIWHEAGGVTPVPEYVRGVSTGPLAPLIVAATTAGGVMHIGATYRKAAFDRGNIDRILAEIRQFIQSF